MQTDHHHQSLACEICAPAHAINILKRMEEIITAFCDEGAAVNAITFTGMWCNGISKNNYQNTRFCAVWPAMSPVVLQRAIMCD